MYGDVWVCIGGGGTRKRDASTEDSVQTHNTSHRAGGDYDHGSGQGRRGSAWRVYTLAHKATLTEMLVGDRTSAHRPGTGTPEGAGGVAAEGDAHTSLHTDTGTGEIDNRV